MRVLPSKLVGCFRCGDAFDFDLDLEDERFAANFAETLLCHACRLAPPDFTRAVSFGLYAAELRELIHLLKFEQVRAVSKRLASHLALAILKLEEPAGNDLLVVAVPLHRRRQRERGYNQSLLLANDALRHLRRLRPTWHLTPAHSLLIRRRDTESSFVLSQRGRRRNLAGAFRVTGDVKGREILLVDDIFTTGATARECARVLIRAGATKVWVATLARAQKGRRGRRHEDPGEAVARWDSPANVPARAEA